MTKTLQIATIRAPWRALVAVRFAGELCEDGLERRAERVEALEHGRMGGVRHDPQLHVGSRAAEDLDAPRRDDGIVLAPHEPQRRLHAGQRGPQVGRRGAGQPGTDTRRPGRARQHRPRVRSGDAGYVAGDARQGEAAHERTARQRCGERAARDGEGRGHRPEEPRGDPRQGRQPGRRDEHQSPHALGMAGGGEDCDRAAHGVADQVVGRGHAGLFEPRHEAVGDLLEREPWARGRRAAVAGEVGRDDAAVVCEVRHDAMPDRAAGPGAVDENERVAGALLADREHGAGGYA
jgi:hypothetical protein